MQRRPESGGGGSYESGLMFSTIDSQTPASEQPVNGPNLFVAHYACSAKWHFVSIGVVSGGLQGLGVRF